MTQNSNIRRIDELGRIVIPKDIRKKLHIKDNEPLEIYIDQEEIKIKKYSALPDILEYIKYLIDIGNRITNNKYIVMDREKIIAANEQSFENIKLNEYFDQLVLMSKEENDIEINTEVQNTNFKTRANIVPIILDNDRSGLIIEYNDKSPGTANIIKLFKGLIEKDLNNY